MADVVTRVSNSVPEGATAILNATIQDENGAATQPATLTLTLFNTHDGAIINSINGTDVIASVTAGVVAHELTGADNPIVDASRVQEWHAAMFEWTWSGGKTGKHVVKFPVRNLLKVT